MDKEMINSVGDQISGAMKQIEEALKNVPQEQRDMAKKMMQEHMPEEQKEAEGAKIKLQKTGQKETRAGYPCHQVTMLYEGRKVRELWVTDWKNIEGGEEASGAFKALGAFFKEMLASLSEEMPDAFGALGTGNMFGDPFDNPFLQFSELDGFPVVSREFAEDGSLESESTLRSSKRMRLDPADFEPPAGYKRQEMFPGR
jgi:hypothetical protein